MRKALIALFLFLTLGSCLLFCATYWPGVTFVKTTGGWSVDWNVGRQFFFPPMGSPRLVLVQGRCEVRIMSDPRPSVKNPYSIGGWALGFDRSYWGLHSSEYWTFKTTLLLPPAIFAGAALLLARAPLRRYRRRRKGLCVKCAYDLTGNTSGTCPECGQDVNDA